jgi:hypothetical protein
MSICYSEMSVRICFAIPWWVHATVRCLFAFVLQSPGEQMLQWDVCSHLFCNPLVSKCYSEMSVRLYNERWILTCGLLAWRCGTAQPAPPNHTLRATWMSRSSSQPSAPCAPHLCQTLASWAAGVRRGMVVIQLIPYDCRDTPNLFVFIAPMSNSCFLGSRCKEGNGGYSTYTIWLPRYTKPFCVHSTHVKLLLPGQQV